MRIFISHIRQDSEIANQISEFLKQQGNEIVSVDFGFPSTNKLQLENSIKKVLNEADAFIILFTKDSISSNWVHYEYNVFAEYSRISDNKKAIIPIVFDDVEPPQSIDERTIFLKGDRKNIKSFAIYLSNLLSRFEGELIAKAEKREKVKEQIEKSSADYVQETLTRLESQESKLKGKADFWYAVGYVSIALGVIVAIIFTLCSSGEKTDNWIKIGLLGIKSAIIIVLLIASSKYCFNLAKTYMNESLKNSDRIHAISFGKFYMQVFGSSVDSKDVKEVFGDWNLDKQSQFMQLNANDYDPKLIELIIKTIEALKEKK